MKADDAIAVAKVARLDVSLDLASRPRTDADAVLSKAEQALQRGEQTRADELAADAQELAERAWYHTVESRSEELRGVWHRPRERSQVEVAATVQRFAAAGYNTVFVETFFHGYAIHPSAVAEQLPAHRGWDPLRAFVEEGRRHGVEIHAWVHTFFVGHEAYDAPGPVLSRHPSWAASDRNGKSHEGSPRSYWPTPRCRRCATTSCPCSPRSLPAMR